jgi:hypothetical protein
MKLIYLEKTLPDARVCRYHRVTELVFSETPNIMKVLVGSWDTVEAASSQAKPDAVTAIDMGYSGDRMDAANNLLERVIQTSGWEGATIIDTSTINAPPPPDLTQIPEVL